MLVFKVVRFKLFFLFFLILFSSRDSYAQAPCIGKSIDAGGDITICQNHTQLITAMVSGGAPDTISWNLLSNPNPILSDSLSLAVPTTSAGTYDYSVSAGFGLCVVRDTVKVTVKPLPTQPSISFSPNTAECSGTPIAFSVTNIQNGVTYFWNFGDGDTAIGANVSHQYNSIGNATVSHTVSVTAMLNGCTLSSTPVTVQIKQRPQAVLLDNTNHFRFCSGGNATLRVFNNSTPSANSNYDIDWGDGSTHYSAATPPLNSSHVYSMGVYNLTYTVTGNTGCVDDTVIPVYNITNPQIGAANPGNTQGCGPKTICFPLNTFAGNDPSTTYRVDFGDGSLTQLFNHPPPDTVCHIYTRSSCGQSGNAYAFKIVAANGCDTSITTIQPIKIYTSPVAQFSVSPSPACVNSSVFFSNLTVEGSSNVCTSDATYIWDFGDGASDFSFSKTSTTHTYTTPGTYTVILTVENFCGLSADTQIVCVEASPTVSFSATPDIGCAPLVVNFTNTSSALNSCGSLTRTWTVTKLSNVCDPESITDYAFISGTTASSANPVIRFNNQGTYRVRLQYTTVCGTFTVSDIITVKGRPNVAVNTLPSICAGGSVFPSANAYACQGTISQYTWSFPNGIPSSSNSLSPGTITYPAAGIQTVSLAVTNECGTRTASVTDTVKAAPVANAGADVSYCSGGSVNIGSFPAPGNTYSWAPSMGLNSTNIANPTVTLATSGNTPISQTYILTVSNGICISRDTVVVTVNPPATVNAGRDTALCNSVTTTLGGVFGGSASSAVWTSNNGGSFSNAASGTSTYTPSILSGNVVLTYTTNNPPGACPAVADSLVIMVVAPPVANAGVDSSICGGASIQIGGPVQVGHTYTWSPSTGLSNTTVSNPVATVTNSGLSIITRTYTLIVNANGCSDTDQVVVSGYPPALANIGAIPAICYGDSIQLNGSVSGGASSATWSSLHGIFTDSTVLNTYFHSAITSGTATLVLTTDNPVGPCPSDTAISTVNVNPIPVITTSPLSQTACDGVPTVAVNLTSSVSGTMYTWFGSSPDGITGFPPNNTTNTIPSFTANNPNSTAGTIIYKVVPNANGCDGDTVTIVYTINPSPNISTIASQAICSGDSTQKVLFTSNIANTTYTWTSSPVTNISGNALSGADSISPQTLLNSGTTNGLVIYTVTPEVNGCPGVSTDFEVTVYPSSIVNNISPEVLCSGEQTSVVTLSSPVSGTTFTWSATGSGGVLGFISNGTGDIPAQTITYSGTTYGTVTYSITPTANTCEGVVQTYTDTIYPIPDVTATSAADSICSGTSTNIVLTTNNAGTTYSWTVSAPSTITGWSNSSGDTIQQVLVNADSVPQQVTYTITPTAHNCSGTPIAVIIKVQPSVVVNFTPSQQSVCSGNASVPVAITSPTSNVIFTWTSQANGVSGVVPSGTNVIPSQVLTNNTTTPINVIYSVVTEYAGCIDSTYKDTIVLNPTSVMDTPLLQAVCEGSPTATINLTSIISGTTYNWQGSSPGGITAFPASGTTNVISAFTPDNPNDTTGIIIYTITPSVNGCAGLPLYDTIVVNPIPDIILPVAQTICNGATSAVVPVSSNTAGTTFTWTSSTTTGTTITTANGTGDIPAQVVTNGTDSVGRATFEITASSGFCSAMDDYVINVNPSPTVLFSDTPQTICSGETTTVVNLSSPTAGVNIVWTATIPAGITGATANGTSVIPAQTLTNTTFAPLTVTYSAQATTGGVLCSGPTAVYSITVNPAPDLSATPAFDTICSVTYTNIHLSSSVAGTIFNWTVNVPPDVTGATAASGDSIVQFLTNTGNNPEEVIYNISTATSGCAGSSLPVSVVVNPSPVVQFSIPDQEICSESSTQEVQITSATTGASIVWTATVPLSVSGAITGGTTIIPLQTLINSSNVQQQVAYSAAATYDGCQGAASVYTVSVNPTPHITNSDTIQTICSSTSNSLIVLTSDVAGATFVWTGVGSTALSGYQTAGNTDTIMLQTILNSSNVADTVHYTVVPAAAGCTGVPQEFLIAVRPLPVASLTPALQKICSENTTLPIVLSSSVAATTYTWTSASSLVGGALPGGNGDTIPAQILQNTSSIADTGFVVYTVTPEAEGCSGVNVSATVQVISKPIVGFASTVSSGCSPLAVSFDANTQTFGSPDSLVFNWGDGTPNTVIYPNPIQPIWSTVPHVFTNTSFNNVVYNVSVTAINNCGDSTAALPITVSPNTSNAFFSTSATTGCEPLTVTFNDFSTGANYTSWCFNYDTVNKACLSSPTVVSSGTTMQHTFSAGTYVVALYITDGCSQDTAYQTIQVNPSPVAEFTYNNDLCQHDSVLFTQQATAVAGSFLTGFDWQFGDGDSSSGSTVSHLYNSPSSYNACLRVSSNNGCSSNRCHTVNVFPQPTVEFLTHDTCLNTQPLQFTNTSVSATGYQWQFGDGASSLSQHPVNNYATEGTYTVTLIGTNGGCADTVSHQVTIHPIPVAAFTVPVSYVCGTLASIGLSNTSSNALTYTWDFGNGAASSFMNPTVTYTNSGNFAITLTAANQFGCFDTAQHSVIVYPTVTADFSLYDTCLNTQPIQFTNTSAGANSYLWRFGDGGSSLVQNPSNNYAAAGTYTVTLVGTTGVCADTVSRQVTVYPVPDAAFTVPVAYVCGTPASVSLTNTSTNAAGYTWHFGDGNSSILTNPTAIYSAGGNYIITLTATNQFGCFDTAQHSVIVHPNIILDFSAYDTCVNTQPIQFANNSSGATFYQWRFGDGNTSVLSNPANYYANAGTYNVTLIGSTNACADTLTRSVIVYPKPVANFTLPVSYFCDTPAVLAITNISSGASGYAWDLGNGLSSTATNPAVTYTSAGTPVITLIAANQFNCYDTAQRALTIYPVPVIESINIQSAEGCQPHSVEVTVNAEHANEYVIDFGDGSLPVTQNTSTATYTYADTGNYTISVRVLSFMDCGDTIVLADTVRVNLTPAAGFNYETNTTVEPIDGTIIFINESQHADSYVWDFGDGITSSDVNPSHHFPDADSFNVMLYAYTGNCVDSVSTTVSVFKRSLWVPNALQPDFVGSNGLVNVWKPVGIGIHPDHYKAQVFNTWGELLWESTKIINTQPAEGWDGTYKGVACPQDVYVWKIYAKFIDNKVWEGMDYGRGKRTIGDITLIR